MRYEELVVLQRMLESYRLVHAHTEVVQRAVVTLRRSIRAARAAIIRNARMEAKANASD